VSDTHDRIDELLAGYVLRSLSGPDGTEADPYAGFEARIVPENITMLPKSANTSTRSGRRRPAIALDAPPIETARDPLLPAAASRELEPRGRGGRWSPARIVAVAASVVLVVGLGGLAHPAGGSAADGASRPGASDEDDARRPRDPRRDLGASR
jgi:hypothetical protein